MSNANPSSIPSGSGEAQIRKLTTPDLTNKKFGRLLVIGFHSYKNKRPAPYWLCKCDCGQIRVVEGRSLTRGRSSSCGCLNNENTVKRNTTHGYTHNPTRIYKIWIGMVQRCTNKKEPHYKDYGGRGIKVCDKWLNSFENFLADVGERPSLKHSLDRFPDNDGNYEPNNIRWATKKEQQENRRDSIRLTVHGQTALISQWSVISGTNPQTIKTRYFRGYSHEECVYGKNKIKNN